MTKQFLPVFLCILLISHFAVAAPKEVVLFPAGAMVTEELRFSAETQRIRFMLPEVALPETLRLELVDAPDQQRISAIEATSILPQVEPFSELQDIIKELKHRIAAREDQVAARRIALAYWQQQTPAPATTTPIDIQQMATLIRSEGESLLTEISELTWQQDELKSQLTEAERQLQQKSNQQRRTWQITAQLSHPLNTPLEVIA